MDDLPLRTPSRVSAMRRPGVILLVYLYRAGVAALVASPVAAIAADVTGRAPRGDAAIFDRGGLLLFETARLARTAVSALTLQGGSLVVLAAFLGLFPLAALVTALGREGKLTLPALLSHASRRIGTLALLFGLALLAEVVVAALLSWLLQGGITRLNLSDPRTDVLRAIVAMLTLAAVLAIGIVHDLARVAAVHRDAHLHTAVSTALRTARARAGGAALAYGWRGALTIAGLVAASIVAARVGVETRRGLLFSFGAHQAAVLFAVVLRASWLAWGIRAIEAVNPREAWEEEPGEVVEVRKSGPWRPNLPTLPVADEELLPAEVEEVRLPRTLDEAKLISGPKKDRMFPVSDDPDPDE